MDSLRFDSLFESIMAGDSIRLSDMYDAGDLDDENEVLWNYADSPDKEHEVRIMPAEEAARLLTHKGDTTVIDSYRRFSKKWQRDLVKTKTRLFDDDRVIVVDGDKVVDGNHHLVAAVKLGRPVKYIDVGAETAPEDKPKHHKAAS